MTLGAPHGLTRLTQAHGLAATFLELESATAAKLCQAGPLTLACTALYFQSTGEADDVRVILARARAELLPVTAMRAVPLLAAYTAKQREGVRSAQRMQAQRAALDRPRHLAAGAASKVCNATAVASAVPSGAAEALAFATNQLVGPAGVARPALQGMAHFVDIAELQRCMVDRGCSDSQVAMALAASRAAGAFATSVEEARVKVLAVVTDNAASAAARATHAGAAGMHLAAVGAWSRALTQPGSFDAQLQMATCREASVSITPATAAAAPCTAAPFAHGEPADGAIGVAQVARGAILWPEELAKASRVIMDVGGDLESLSSSSASILSALDALNAKLAASADLAKKTAFLVESFSTAVLGAAKANAYIANMTKASDALARFLAAPSDLHPADVWIAPQPSPFTAGPRAWELVSNSIASLEEAYLGARRSDVVCTDVNAAQAVDALEQRLLAVHDRAASAGLPYSTLLVEAADMQGNSTCLIAQLARTMHVSLLKLRISPGHGQPSRQRHAPDQCLCGRGL